MSIITGYEVYIKRAERSGQLDGWDVKTEGNVNDNSLKSVITIYRKDRKYPFTHEVMYSEYVQKTKEGKVTQFWEKAYTMIKKVAISQGFRLCFSDELGGMPYTSEEIPEQTQTVDVTHTEVEPVLQVLPTKLKLTKEQFDEWAKQIEQGDKEAVQLEMENFIISEKSLKALHELIQNN